MHIADLITESSNYERAWITALQNLGANIENTVSIVNRNQGGKEVLKNKNISLFSFASIEKDLFVKALEENYITGKQCEMISLFIENPDKFMLEFLDNNPNFLDDNIHKGGKNKERALLCKEIYKR